GYDANGSQTSVSRTGSSPETDTYTYDFHHQIKTATISRIEQGQQVTIAASYVYNESGVRVQGTVTTTIGSGSPTTTTTQYLLDSANPSGFVQVLEEHTDGSATPSMSYQIGQSVFGQTNGSGASNILLADGQGSTRLLTDGAGVILNRYAYDAY